MSGLTIHGGNWPNKFYVRWWGRRALDSWSDEQKKLYKQLKWSNGPNQIIIDTLIEWCHKNTDGRLWSVTIPSKQDIFAGKIDEHIHGEWWCFEDETDALLFKLSIDQN